MCLILYFTEYIPPEFKLSQFLGQIKSLRLRPKAVKGADLFQKGGRTKKQAAGRGTSRYSIMIKSWPELISN